MTRGNVRNRSILHGCYSHPVPLGSPTSPARAAAARAAATAEQLASDDAPAQPTGPQRRSGDAVQPSRRAAQVDQPLRPSRP